MTVRLDRFHLNSEDGELEMTFTLARDAFRRTMVDAPRAADIPEDMRDGLRAWLDNGPAALDPAVVGRDAELEELRAELK